MDILLFVLELQSDSWILILSCVHGISNPLYNYIIYKCTYIYVLHYAVAQMIAYKCLNMSKVQYLGPIIPFSELKNKLEVKSYDQKTGIEKLHDFLGTVYLFEFTR